MNPVTSLSQSKNLLLNHSVNGSNLGEHADKKTTVATTQVGQPIITSATSHLTHKDTKSKPVATSKREQDQTPFSVEKLEKKHPKIQPLIFYRIAHYLRNVNAFYLAYSCSDAKSVAIPFGDQKGYLHDLIFRDLKRLGYQFDPNTWPKEFEQLGGQHDPEFSREFISKVRRQIIKIILEIKFKNEADAKEVRSDDDLPILKAFFPAGKNNTSPLIPLIDICKNPPDVHRETSLVNFAKDECSFDMRFEIAKNMSGEGYKSNLFLYLLKHAKENLSQETAKEIFAFAKGIPAAKGFSCELRRTLLFSSLLEHAKDKLSEQTVKEIFAFAKGISELSLKQFLFSSFLENAKDNLSQDNLSEIFAFAKNNSGLSLKRKFYLRFFEYTKETSGQDNLREIFAAATAFSDKLSQCYLFSNLLKHANDHITQENVGEIIKITKNMKEESNKQKLLSHLIEYGLPQTTQHTLNEMIAIINTLSDESVKSSLLSSLAKNEASKDNRKCS